MLRKYTLQTDNVPWILLLQYMYIFRSGYNIPRNRVLQYLDVVIPLGNLNLYRLESPEEVELSFHWSKAGKQRTRKRSKLSNWDSPVITSSSVVYIRLLSPLLLHVFYFHLSVGLACWYLMSAMKILGVEIGLCFLNYLQITSNTISIPKPSQECWFWRDNSARQQRIVSNGTAM